MLSNAQADLQERSEPPTVDTTANTSDEIGFKDAVFSWAKPVNPPSLTFKNAFKLRIPGEVFFKKDKINLIVGPTASGKTSLLMALLGKFQLLGVPCLLSIYRIFVRRDVLFGSEPGIMV